LLREAEAAERKAAAAAIKIEAKEEQAASIIAPVVEVAKTTPKVEGASTRKIWKARVVDMDAVIQAAFDPSSIARSFLTFNEKVADAFAKSTKGAIPVKGVEFYQEDNLAIGGGR